MTSWTEILKANKGLHARDSFSELWGLKLKAARAEFPDYTITGTLPLTFLSKGDDLKDYRIHGTSEGAGVETESGEPAGFKIPILNTSGVTENKFDEQGSGLIQVDAQGNTRFGKNIGTVTAGDYYVSFATPVKNPVYAIIKIGNTYTNLGGGSYEPHTITVASEGELILRTATPLTTTWEDYLGTSPCQIMITKGSTPPDHYIPHRYESNYDLFIGDSKLLADEYVDFGEQKVWKMVDGTLTPTDTPVPLPPIPSYKGENTLSSTETLGEVSITGKITEMA